MDHIEGKFFIDGQMIDTAVTIDNGKIISIGYEKKRSGNVTKMEGIILPGFVDPHVHFRDPGMTQKEDFDSGTMSALHAGVTCVLDMPNTVPAVTTPETFNEKKKTISSKAYVDYGLFAALTCDTDVTRMAQISAGFKLFMGSTTGNILMNDQAVIERKLKEIRSTGLAVSVHAEDDFMISRAEELSNADHLKNRPLDAELNAVRRLKGFNVNICHATSSDTVDLANAQNMTMEVTAHHLLLEAVGSDTHYKVNPPLRSETVRRGLLNAFLNGKVTMVGSDHAPHRESEKLQAYGNAPSGISCVETTIPIMMDMVRSGMLPLSELIRMASTEPARIFGMNKGCIREGCDADLVVVDLNDVRKINGKQLHGKTDMTVYEGWNAVFPKTVMVRGNIQLQDGEFCGDRIGEDIRG